MSFCLRPAGNIALVTRILIVVLWMDVCIFAESPNVLGFSMSLEDSADPCFCLIQDDCQASFEKFMKMVASIQLISFRSFLFLFYFLKLPLNDCFLGRGYKMLLRLFLFFVTIDSITKTNRYCQGSAKSFQEKKRRMRENRQGKY